MPTEKQLAERFGVSRTVIREAVSRLKADGSVETRQGAGAFVSANPGANAFKLAHGAPPDTRDLTHILELRITVETAAAELAARRRTKEDIETMHSHWERMDEAVRQKADRSVLDGCFHGSIGAATHNPYIRRFIEFLGHQFAETRRRTWSAEGHRVGMPAEANREHERIFRAIAAGDPWAARHTAAAHLRATGRRMGLDMGEP